MDDNTEIDIIIKVNGKHEYSASDISNIYEIARLFKLIQSIEESSKNQIDNILEQINKIEPDKNKQVSAVKIAQAAKSQLPLLIDI